MTQLKNILTYTGLIAVIYFVVTLTLAGIVSVVQEGKIWAPKGLPSLSLWGKVKIFALNVIWCAGCFVGVCLVLLKYIVTLGSTDVAHDINTLVEPIVAGFVLRLFVGHVQVVGQENLPPPDLIPAPVYVANHASQIDVAAVYALGRRFKWIAKQSILYLPGVGQVMWLGDHVLIQRSGKNKNSVKELFAKSEKSVLSGLSMFFFPQGKRWMARPPMDFKDGAFIVAQNTKAPLVPLSVDIPPNAWNSMYPFGSETPVVKITIHPIIPVKGDEPRDQLKQTCAHKIYSVIPDLTETFKNK